MQYYLTNWDLSCQPDCNPGNPAGARHYWECQHAARYRILTMAKTDPIERALDRLGELRSAPPSESLVEELRGFLCHRSNLVIAKAARVARELRIASLLSEMVEAFQKLMKDAPRLDKRCAAVTELATSFYELDYDDPEPYLKGLKHVQPEASFGPPVDEAAKLRAVSAQGLLRTRYPDALAEVMPLLVDREPAARAGAVRALAANGGEAGALLLRLKVLTGDSEPAVIADCFGGLLATSPGKSVAFVAPYIDSEDEAVAEAAMLALGESRLNAAYHVLREKWERSVGSPSRKTLLVAIASSRLDDAVSFLISLVESSSPQTAGDTIEALSIYRHSERIADAVHDAVVARGEKRLLARFTQDFAKSG